MDAGPQSAPKNWRLVVGTVAATLAVLFVLFIGTPNLLRSRMAADRASRARAEQMATGLGPPLGDEDGKAAAEPDRKMVRTCALDIVVKEPSRSADQIRVMAEGMGGFVVTSESGGGLASITVRVPAAQAEEAIAGIRKLGLRVESEKREAQDVTREYVDSEARLHNLRAEETQYLGILKQAKTVKDTLEVSEKLNEVRGKIEEHQAEFEALSKQVETVAISVSLRAEQDAQVFGLHWRPLYQLKIAARDGLDSLGDYFSAMVAFAFYLPTIALWVMTLLLGAVAAWRTLRWAARRFFDFPKRQVEVKVVGQ